MPFVWICAMCHVPSHTYTQHTRVHFRKAVYILSGGFQEDMGTHSARFLALSIWHTDIRTYIHKHIWGKHNTYDNDNILSHLPGTCEYYMRRRIKEYRMFYFIYSMFVADVRMCRGGSSVNAEKLPTLNSFWEVVVHCSHMSHFLFTAENGLLCVLRTVKCHILFFSSEQFLPCAESCMFDHKLLTKMSVFQDQTAGTSDPIILKAIACYHISNQILIAHMGCVFV